MNLSSEIPSSCVSFESGFWREVGSNCHSVQIMISQPVIKPYERCLVAVRFTTLPFHSQILELVEADIIDIYHLCTLSFLLFLQLSPRRFRVQPWKPTCFDIQKFFEVNNEVMHSYMFLQLVLLVFRNLQFSSWLLALPPI